jgi:flagellar basal body-associated protein FliL
MQLLLDNPLWIVVIVLTVLLHVGFYIGIRRVIRKSEEKKAEEGCE